MSQKSIKIMGDHLMELECDRFFYPTSSPLIFLAILSVVVDQYKLQVSVCQRTKASKILDQGNHSDPGELKLIFDTQDRVQKICCPAPMVNRQGPPFSNGCFEV